MMCLYCETAGPYPLYPAMTAYACSPCEHEDCLENREMRTLCFENRDANKPMVMCPTCADEYREFWEEQWREYYAGLM